ncbi:MAG: orotate phosphoribosyltransferase [Proteobacteria bacterium]|nr:orotate phosphoribosyltransferase [Pseudomonadota bacterium]
MPKRKPINAAETLQDRDRLLELLRKFSLEKRDVILSSGRKSNYYVDGKQTTLNPEGIYLTTKLLYQRIRALPLRADAVGGLTLGADPLVSALALWSQLEKDPLSAFIVRKEAKGHGTGAWMEGLKNVSPAARVVIVEDVVTTGDSALRAIARSEECGFSVIRVMALLDRQEGGREKLKEKGYELEAIFNREELLGG